MKKLVLATATLAASLGAYAALPTSAQSFQLEIPNLKPGLLVTLEGNMLRPSSSDLDYAGLDTFSFNGNNNVNNNNGINFSANQQVQSVEPGYDFGFRVGLGYVFPNSGNDIQLNWTHFDNDDDASVSAGPGQVLITESGIPLINFQNAFQNVTIPTVITGSSDVDFKMDAVDLDVGQYVNVGTRLQMRLFGGLRAARVEQNTSDNFFASYDFSQVFNNNNGTNVLTFNGHDQLDSEFKGIGPRFGVDTSYHVWNCFGVVAHVAAALLIGQTDTSTTSTAVIDNNNQRNRDIFPVTLTTSTNADESDRIVPALDAKLGMDYTWEFQNRSSLSVEAGWQATQYINAVDKFDNSISNAFGLGSVNRETTSVGYDGPYLSLNFHV